MVKCSLTPKQLTGVSSEIVVEETIQDIISVASNKPIHEVRLKYIPVYHASFDTQKLTCYNH